MSQHTNKNRYKTNTIMLNSKNSKTCKKVKTKINVKVKTQRKQIMQKNQKNTNKNSKITTN